ncbi:MAG: winged helix-turn-helix domain-containing protein [Novosphingobium sp.]|nr:winged helix-turn-helix domain-containing protein [Novosphingobium sp.]
MGDEKLLFDLGSVAAPSPVPLAHVAPFALGPLAVEPARRRIGMPGGASAMLEPLVLQVLIALASSKGATLSRDDLVVACWDGRIVSDDAINRVVSKVRRTLAELADGAVRLETVPKVGYRLTVAEAAYAAPSVTAIKGGAPSRRGLAITGALTLIALTVGGAAWAYFVRDRASSEVTIAVEPIASTSPDREVGGFASALTGDLARLAGAISRVSVVESADAGASRENLVLRIAVEREQDLLIARVRLVEGLTGAVLWSDRFVNSRGAPDLLRQRVAMAAAGVMRCGLERSAAILGDATSTRLFFSACNAVMQGDFAKGESFARQVVARRPDVAAGWACLALTTLGSGMGPDTTPRQLADARIEARRYALRALRLDPQVGRAYQALAMAAPQGSAHQFAILDKGIAADPELPALHRVKSQALFSAGYVGASIAPAQRALALDPTSAVEFGNLQRRLAAIGRIDEVREMQAKAERQWPGDHWAMNNRLFLLRLELDARKALAELERVAESSPNSRPLPRLLRAELRWRADPAARDLAAFEREAEADFVENPASAWVTAATLARLGETERAFAWINRVPPGDHQNQWSFLFWSDTAPIRRDPRFFAAMVRLGLIEVWRAKNQWPDFCSEPGLRYDCRAEAARAQARVRS